jgi:hypothetical protein
VAARDWARLALIHYTESQPSGRTTPRTELRTPEVIELGDGTSGYDCAPSHAPHSAAIVKPPVLVRRRGREGKRLLVVGAFLVGLAIRLALLPYLGTNDVHSYLQMGAETNAHGLARAYTGGYFPFSYETFQVPVALSSPLGVSSHTLLKALMFLFDLGCFTLLLALLPRWGVRKEFALFYWLQPYFLVLGWLAYVDFEMGFFALLTVLILQMRPTPLGGLLAGVPLGLDLLLKPQALTLVVTVVLLATAGFLRRGAALRTARWAALMLVAPALMFVGYSAYFYRAGYSATHLAATYVNTPNFSVALTADMLNIWYPIAEAFRDSGQEIYNVTQPGAAHGASKVITAGLFLFTAAWFTWYGRRLSPAVLLAGAFAATTAILPMTLTGAHENHFFLGGLLGTALLGVVRTPRFAIALTVSLLAQFTYLFARYGFGVNDLASTWPARTIRQLSRFDVSTGLALINVVAVAVVLFELFRFARRGDASPRVEPQTSRVSDREPLPSGPLAQPDM